MKWIKCQEQMPEERKYESNDCWGHHEWTESDRVLVWDSLYGAGVDFTKNGKWMSEPRGIHRIIAWMPIPKFEEE